MTYILRRRKLGLTSCREMSKFSKTGITFVRNDKPLPQDPNELCIRWGCTSNVPQKRVLNKAKAIHLVADKTRFRGLLDDEELCPQTWDNTHAWIRDFEEGTTYILRPSVHHQGRNFHVIMSIDEGIQWAQHYLNKGKGYYISPFIDKVAEYRVFVVSGRVACVAQKTPANPKDYAWNVAKGGRFDNVRWDDWPLKAVRVSVEAFKLSGLDFGGVDIMVDRDGGVHVLEINSAPSLTSPYRQECMAKCFDYIVQHGKEHIPLITERGGYLKFIHPAITPKAKV